MKTYIQAPDPYKKEKQRKTRTSKFSTPEKRLLVKACGSIIRKGRISQDRIKNALQSSDILTKYSYGQIRTRLKYERDLAHPLEQVMFFKVTLDKALIYMRFKHNLQVLVYTRFKCKFNEVVFFLSGSFTKERFLYWFLFVSFVQLFVVAKY